MENSSLESFSGSVATSILYLMTNTSEWLLAQYSKSGMSVSHSVFYLLANTQDSFVSPRSKESLLVHRRCPITRMQDYMASSQARLRTWDCRSQSWRDCRLGIGSGEASEVTGAWLFAVFSHGRGAKRASRISFTRTLVRVGWAESKPYWDHYRKGKE